MGQGAPRGAGLQAICRALAVEGQDRRRELGRQGELAPRCVGGVPGYQPHAGKGEIIDEKRVT